MKGFVVFDKPPGITSHDVVAMFRAVTGIRKVGHTGTLDPFATGVLALAVGGATRLIQYLDEDLKVYDAMLQLGQATDTGDPEGEVIAEAPVPEVGDDAVRAVLAGFVGERMQTPPPYSAVKVNGRPLYSYARAGEHVEVPARPIRVDAVELLGWQAPHMRVRITCGKGTYARVLAEEIGEALGSVAHLIGLRRERSGPFTLERSLAPAALSSLVAGTEDWQAALRPARGAERMPWRPRDEVRAGLAGVLWSPAEAMARPGIALNPRELKRVQSGGLPPPPPGEVADGGLYLLMDGPELIAVARREGAGGVLVRVMPYDSSGSGSGGPSRRRRR